MQNAAVVQAIVGLVTAAVWITYLHVFVESMRRGRRSEILITLGDDRLVLRPETLYAEQIRDARGRRRIERQLADLL